MFDSPEAVEDAYYDALEAGDYDAVMAAWADGDDIACALPMAPFAVGRSSVESVWREILSNLGPIDLQTHHVQWIRLGDTAIHLVEESATASAPGQPAPQPVYATNVYQRGDAGWRMVLHQNSPTPPPAGAGPGAASPVI